MKRLILTLFISTLLSWSVTISAQETTEKTAAAKTELTELTIVEGQHYTRLDKPIKVTTGEKIEVRELFWYGCPHCNRLEPVIINWLKTKPENTEFVPTPAVFSQRWVFHAQAYYTIKTLGIDEVAHPMIFDSIHHKRQPINNLKQLSKFIKANFNIDSDKVKKAFESFSVDSNMRAANAYSLKSGANGVPTVIVDGKFRANVQSAGGNQQLFDVVDQLIVLAESERKS